MKRNLGFIKTSKRKKVKKIKFSKNVSFWDELPKIADLKNKPMGLNKDDEIIYS